MDSLIPFARAVIGFVSVAIVRSMETRTPNFFSERNGLSRLLMRLKGRAAPTRKMLRSKCEKTRRYVVAQRTIAGQGMTGNKKNAAARKQAFVQHRADRDKVGAFLVPIVRVNLLDKQ